MGQENMNIEHSLKKPAMNEYRDCRVQQFFLKLCTGCLNSSGFCTHTVWVSCLMNTTGDNPQINMVLLWDGESLRLHAACKLDRNKNESLYCPVKST